MLYLLISACVLGLVAAETFNKFVLKNVGQGLTNADDYGIITL